jgi:gliding motility-associated-like protein
MPEIVEINIPNIFSPNNDAINDYFTFYSGQADQISEIRTMQIFDRWGDLVFIANHIAINEDKEGWDGKMKSKTPMAGVYAYYGEVLLLSGETIKVVGDVTLIR